MKKRYPRRSQPSHQKQSVKPPAKRTQIDNAFSWCFIMSVSSGILQENLYINYSFCLLLKQQGGEEYKR